MLCPSCKNEMLLIEMNDVEADWCPGCNGIWLDEGELEIISKIESAESPIIKAIHNIGGSDGNRKCPRCGIFMKIRKVPTSPEIELDICPKGHGVWFDNGELEKILRELSAEPLAKAICDLLKN